MKWLIPAICIGFMISNAAYAAPKEVHHKGNPADQEILDLAATVTDDTDMKADGNLTDWDEDNGTKVKFQTLLSGEYEYDWTGPKDLSGTVMAQYGADKIYFLIQAKDNAVVAKKKQWKSDRAELWLSPETADGKSLGNPRGILLDVGPQVAGDKATIKWMSGKAGGLEGAAYVGPSDYDFEVAVDYSALSKVSPAMHGVMRYCVIIRDWDQDDDNEDEASIGTCPINPSKTSSIKPAIMGKIPLRLGDEMWKQVVLNDTYIAGKSNWNRIEADIGGDSHPEIIAFSGDTLVVAGIGLSSPKLSWYKMSLEAESGTAATITAKDVDGDKRNEIVVKRTERCLNGPMSADREYVFKYDEGMRLVTNYVTEQRSDDGSEYIRNTVKISKGSVVQTYDKKSSDMSICQLSGSADMVPILSPADSMLSRTVPLN